MRRAGHGLGRAFLDQSFADITHGTQENKADPSEVARVGFKAMMDAEDDVVAGLKNKLQSAIASVTPASVLAEQHRKMAEPGSAKGKRGN